MKINPSKKYRPFSPIDLPSRQWPSRTLVKAPIWCAVDLRDGNQALIDPMDSARKHMFFDMLVKCGFKEIEIAFPSASQTDFDFTRELIERGKAKNVVLQVLTQAREELIDRTFEALSGAPQAIMHLYNSTSPVQRRVVFQKEPHEIVALAVQGAKQVLERVKQHPETKWMLEYSPESFTGTELDFALEITEAVLNVWQPTPDNKVIVNLPATVEMSTPNVYADQIEYFSNKVRGRENIILSVHPHNDRGTAVAASELALMAGAERLEGTLFGNGERTGNADLVTVALNLFSQGIDPGLDFSNIREIVKVVENCNQIPVHIRHPYAGDLVFTAFSGSHQDAIRKGLRARKDNEAWEVPYLPIDPADVGRAYEPIIRINSQSGKGGVAFILEQDHGFALPKKMQAEFSHVVQKITDKTKQAISSQQVLEAFLDEYVRCIEPFAFIGYQEKPVGEQCCGSFKLQKTGKPLAFEAAGNGLLDALTKGLSAHLGFPLDILSYTEHAATVGSTSNAIAYVETGSALWESSFGIGIDSNFVVASMKAILNSLNRGLRDRS
ncbi:MAG: 2-isopropylmalate synthase [Alphaproteobacteria bacterium]|nr:2-isopropylmalate synthase [Alphaproteobacteria bacterium]